LLNTPTSYLPSADAGCETLFLATAITVSGM